MLGIMIGMPFGLIVGFFLWHLWLEPLADRLYDWIDERKSRRRRR
jgi:hypothetical protein